MFMQYTIFKISYKRRLLIDPLLHHSIYSQMRYKLILQMSRRDLSQMYVNTFVCKMTKKSMFIYVFI